MSDSANGRLVIISGPSGAGKSTVVKRLLETCPLPLSLSVSATTRSPRPGEQDGKHYHFLSRSEFLRRRDAGEFLEWKEVYGCGDYYGTLRDATSSGLAAGQWVILEIDVQGALAVIEQHPDVITIFLHSGSMGELERRLRIRGTETETTIRRRLEAAAGELATASQYRYLVVNDNVERAVNELCEILKNEEGS
jgi:guanylate kinase